VSAKGKALARSLTNYFPILHIRLKLLAPCEQKFRVPLSRNETLDVAAAAQELVQKAHPAISPDRSGPGSNSR
jgi:hypothetical protein